MPSQGQIEEWFRRFEHHTQHTLGRSPRSLARSLRGLSFAEIEDFGTDVMRKIVLSEPNADTENITAQRLRHLKKRFSVSQADAPEEVR